MTLPVSKVRGEPSASGANRRHMLRPGISSLINQVPGKTPGTHISIFKLTQAETMMVIIVYEHIEATGSKVALLVVMENPVS
jgi:hypothetical protein